MKVLVFFIIWGFNFFGLDKCVFFFFVLNDLINCFRLVMVFINVIKFLNFLNLLIKGVLVSCVFCMIMFVFIFLLFLELINGSIVLW